MQSPDCAAQFVDFPVTIGLYRRLFDGIAMGVAKLLIAPSIILGVICTGDEPDPMSV